jgi:hypothetical protein
MERVRYQHDKLDLVPGSVYADGVDKFDEEGNFRKNSNGNLVSSLITHDTHWPVIDFDGIDMKLVPSRTVGGYHLYIDAPISSYQYRKLLVALVSCNLVEEGILTAFDSRGFTTVRHPDTFEPHSRKVADKIESNIAIRKAYFEKFEEATTIETGDNGVSN